MPDGVLTPTAVEVLCALLAHTEPRHVSELEVEGRSQAGVTRALDSLEREGLVDYRSAGYTLTEPGRAAALRIAASPARRNR